MLGVEARDDRPARPGVLGQLRVITIRLSRVESRLSTVETRISMVEAEFTPNGGGSIKDQVTRIEQATGATAVEPT